MDANIANIPTGWMVVIVAVAIWELAWKGVALWHASRRDDKSWFVIMLVVNTAGLLPIVYLLMTRQKTGVRKVEQDA